MLDAYKLKALISGNTIPVNPSEGIKRTNKLLDSYMELSLPYLFEEGKIKTDNTHLGQVTSDKLKAWDAILSAANSTQKK